MNPLEFHHPGWLFLAIVAQATAAILVAAVVAGAGLRRRPAARHAVWLCALACTLAGPVVASIVDRAGLTLPVIPWTRAVVVASEPAPPAPVFQPDERGEPNPPPAVRTSRPSGPEQPRAAIAPTTRAAETKLEMRPVPTGGRFAPYRVPAILWGTGVALGLARVAVGRRRLRRLRRSLRPFDAGGVSIEVRETLGGLELPSIATSPLVAGPVAIGLRRPVVVLPEGLAETLAPDELRDVLIHECAHIRRRDLWIGVLQRLAAVFYWPHPLIHYMNSRLARAREEVCDNFVLRRGDPCGYARTLLKLTERRGACAAYVGIGLTDGRWSLKDRIAGLLDPRRDTMTRSNRRAVGAAVLLSALVCLTVAGLRPAGPVAAVASPAREPAAGSSERTTQGVVVDEAGKPVAGITVRTTRTVKAARPVKTDAEGRFTLATDSPMGVPESLVASTDDGDLMGIGVPVQPQSGGVTGRTRMMIKSRNGAGAKKKIDVGNPVEPPKPGPAQPLKIVLKPSRTVVVQVRDQAGAPVPEASVAVGDFGGFEFNATGKTDAEGEATFRVPADAQVSSVVGLKPGVGFDYFEIYRSQPGFTPSTPSFKATLTLDGARTVRVKAVDTAGRPVPNARFQPFVIYKKGKYGGADFIGTEIGRVFTDADGVAVLDWIPVHTRREVQFILASDVYTCPQSLMSGPHDGSVEFQARLFRGVPIGGVVRDGDGRPVPDVQVSIAGRGAARQFQRDVRTGPDGSYSLDVEPDQSYMIAARDDRRVARSLTGIVAREGHPIAGLDLKLEEGAIVRGRVTRKRDGAPAAGEAVNIVQLGATLPKEFLTPLGYGDTERLLTWATTDAEGRYRLRVAPGRYELPAPKDPWDHEIDKPETIVIEAPAEIVRDFRISEPTQPMRIDGQVVLDIAPGERSIEDLKIEGSPIGRPASRIVFAMSDTSGRFGLPVDGDGDHVLYVHDDAGQLAGFTRVKEGAVDVKAAAGPASRIRGRVVDKAGRPKPGRWVRLQLYSGPNPADAGHFQAQAMTDPDGRYEFAKIVVGANAEVSITHDVNPRAGGPAEIHKLEVPNAEPVTAPDLVVPVG